MIFGTHYRNIEDITSLVEHHLGVTLVRFDHPELGVSYSLVQEIDGTIEEVFEIASTKVYDKEENIYVSVDPDYEIYSYIIDVNDMFPQVVTIFLNMIETGVIKAEPIQDYLNPEWL